MRLWNRTINWQQMLNGFLTGMITLGDVLMVFMQTIIVSFGALAIMLLLLWVEINAISQGVMIFEPVADKASAAATVLVLFNFAVKFWVVYIESMAGDQRQRYKPSKQYAFSLRTWLGDVGYVLGIGTPGRDKKPGKPWQRRELPASAEFSSVGKLLVVAMLYVAFVGRTHEAMVKVSANADGQPVPWQQGFDALLQNSTLADLTVWITALVFTFAAVIATQRLTQYVAVRVVEIRRTLSVRPSGRPVRPLLSAASTGRPLSITGTVDTSGREYGHGQGYNRNVDARTEVRTYLADNPAALNIPSRELAETVGLAGKSVWSEELAAAKRRAGNGTNRSAVREAQQYLNEVPDNE